MHLGSKSKECLRSHIIEGFFTYSRGAYINFLHEERKMRRLFFARRAYSTHFTCRVEKKWFYSRGDVCARAKRGWKDHTRIKSLSHSCIEHNSFILITTCYTKLDLAHALLFERAQSEHCARSVKIVIFDTSAKKCFYPREDVCARAKRGWKGHTRIKSLSHSRIEHNFFIRRVQSLI